MIRTFVKNLRYYLDRCLRAEGDVEVQVLWFVRFCEHMSNNIQTARAIPHLMRVTKYSYFRMFSKYRIRGDFNDSFYQILFGLEVDEDIEWHSDLSHLRHLLSVEGAGTIIQKLRLIDDRVICPIHNLEDILFIEAKLTSYFSDNLGIIDQCRRLRLASKQESKNLESESIHYLLDDLKSHHGAKLIRIVRDCLGPLRSSLLREINPRILMEEIESDIQSRKDYLGWLRESDIYDPEFKENS